MTTKYPNAIDGYNEIRVARDHIDEIIASDHNDERSAILAIEQTLGIRPQGMYGTIVARFNAVEGELGVSGSGFTDHVGGTDYRHSDTHIDSVAKTSTYNSIAIGTTGTQLQDLLELFDYPGSSPTTFADSIGVTAQSLATTVTNIVSQLGSADGYEKIGAPIVVGSPHSLSSGAISNHTTEILGILNSIASTSTPGSTLVGIDNGGFVILTGTNVQTVLASADGYINTLSNTSSELVVDTAALFGHTSVFVSCTDGYTSTGGLFNGADAIESAIDAYGTPDGYGATILVRRGNYEFVTNSSIQSKINLIGVEEGVIITNKVGSDYMINFLSTDSYGSSVENVSIIQDVSLGSGRNISIKGNQISLKKVSSDGNIRLDGYRNKIDQCDLTLNTVLVSSILDAYGATWACEVCNTRFQTFNSGDLAVYFDGDDILFDNCMFLTADGTSAFTDTVNSQRLVLRKCRFESQPYTPGTTVLNVVGINPTLEDIFIKVAGAGDVDAYVINVFTDTVRARNIQIQLGSNRLAYMNTLSDSPIIFAANNGIVDGIDISGGTIPTIGTDGFTLDSNVPIIQLTGYEKNNTLGVMRLMNGRVKAPGESTPSGIMDFSLMGSLNTAGSPATTSGAFELHNIDVDGYNTPTFDGLSGDLKYMVTGIQPGSLIKNCTFTGGAWSTMIQVVDVDDVQIIGNKLDRTIVNASEQMILLFADVGTVTRTAINNNSIFFNSVDITADSYGGISILGATYGTVNNNIIWNSSSDSYGIPLILFGPLSRGNIGMGNNLHTGDGLATNIPILDVDGYDGYNLFDHGILTGDAYGWDLNFAS